MPFYADLHIHSRYSRACSKDGDLQRLAWWARHKGLDVVGTGDFTHPLWFEHLSDSLVPAEPGLFRLRDELAASVERRLPPSCRGPVQFMLSVEIATIYKRGGKTRKVHHLLYVPDFDSARNVARELGKVGNLASDGRPILGLDSRDLLEIVLEAGPDCYLVPAHIWTPWFSVLGSKSGFDTVTDCYADLAEHIFAVETGLSSDPSMNYRLSRLDGYRLVSNSDAHSPPMLGREATVFHTRPDFFAIRDALRGDDSTVETVEFFPEGGKYHLDGHRRCGRRLHPARTRELAGHRCPDCDRPLTIGVLHRVEELADRPQGITRAEPDPYHHLVPLPELIAEIRGVGRTTKTVREETERLVAQLGPELHVLRHASLDEINRVSPPSLRSLSESIARLRRGEVLTAGGYDGEYGTIRMFEPGETRPDSAATPLFDLPPDERGTVPADASESVARSRNPAASPTGTAAPDTTIGSPQRAPVPASSSDSDTENPFLKHLDAEQRSVVTSVHGPLLVVAGPGTGKTRALTHRIAHLVTDHQAPPERCLALTFTRRARDEMRLRLQELIGSRRGAEVHVTTFHGLGAALLRESPELAGLAEGYRIAEDNERLEIATEVTGSPTEARRLVREPRNRATGDSKEASNGKDSRTRYRKALHSANLVDFDDLVSLPVELLEANPRLARRHRERYRWICIDEYQDVDEQQYRLLQALSTPNGNVCAIGDPDQAIYGFRGADVGFFLRFREDYPSADRIGLWRNYRSSSAIVDGARQVVRPSTLVPDRALRSVQDPPTGARIGVRACADENLEAETVVRAIDQLLGGASFHSLDSGRVDYERLGDEGAGTGSLSFSDIAVLYRTDTAARPVVDALTAAGMPFRKRSHDRLSARSGVGEILRELEHDRRPDSAGIRAAATRVLDTLPPSTAARRQAELATAAELLIPVAERCGGDSEAFLHELALGVEVDAWDPRGDFVSLLTIHAAKGLEFPVVFLVGCEDGVMPLRWPGDDVETGLAEERRVFFVGMTRARDQLFLSHARTRTQGGKSRETTPSRFLADLGQQVTDSNETTRTRTRRPRQLRLL